MSFVVKISHRNGKMFRSEPDTLVRRGWSLASLEMLPMLSACIDL